ncbi:putative protein arginine N-methyltransferase 6 [Tetrabaena socialis]|uniref:Methyltransferase domain-containing protein n=1 Tax=Tetrabaena socialis TaxID=47790 RepID=A0A2J7ZQH1_9CHLO|nr:putative protein arginine N-methyltransferase 6 [Tetrabaena socialis]|eukprot:PNH02506.1 putative protein arginine N-methyltransferase 6 [Tetrabaena socialis]
MQRSAIAGGVSAASPSPALSILASGRLVHCHSLAPPAGSITQQERGHRSASASRRSTAAAASQGTREASTSGSSSSAATAGGSSLVRSGDGGQGGGVAQPRRLVLSVETGQPTINWDRWELLQFEREAARVAQGGEVGDEDGDGEAEEAEADVFAQRLAGSDLSAAYFRRWDDPALHQPMLQDRVLIAAWRKALEAAPPGALAGKVVLDVGCGLGLLSMLAAKAGAARVVAVDGSAGAVEAARRIIRANGLQDKITVVHGALEELEELPGVAPGSVDVVLSNWMGPGLLAGGMLNTMAHAARLTAVREERLFGLVLYWEAAWTFGGALAGGDDAKPPVRFTTHPLSSTTHYQQLMVDFPRPQRAEEVRK